MNKFYWNPEKNELLKKVRKATFDDLVNARFIGMEDHPKKLHQRLMLVEYKDQVWVIPHVEGKGYYFLKTAFPSRKHTRKYLGR